MQHASNVLLVIHSRAALGTAGISILGAFAKLRKATFSFVICLSVRMEQLGSHWTDFHEI
jgi:hypothetical protein